MPRYFAALTIVVLLGMVLSRVFIMKETRHKGDAFREHGQEGFFDPAIRLFLFLYHIRRRI